MNHFKIMKMHVVVGMVGLVLASCAGAGQKLSVTELPKPVVRSFGLAYPEIEDEKWVKARHGSKVVYAAAWKKDGKKSEAEFDEKGNFIREQYR